MVSRRDFNLGLVSAAAATALPKTGIAQATYRGPNVVIVRFGGGVRRRETIDPSESYAPYFLHKMAPRGVLIPDVTIDQMKGGNTSHAEGTLNILTGRYEGYRDAGSKFLQDRLEPTEPTLFEYFRESFDIPSHQALLINGEDRQQEEFFTYGVHGNYGIDYRSETLSLNRFKLYKFARILEEGTLPTEDLEATAQSYQELLNADTRDIQPDQSALVNEFWEGWRRDYGDSGFKNPRGDRLLTVLSLRAMTELRPRLLMINYQDPDYVHWGNASHYTRAISVIDQGLERLVNFVDNDDFYAGNTVFVVVPDCGRDANDLIDLPFQHHFNTRSSREIFAFFMGPGISKGRVMDKAIDQTAIAPTVAAMMGMKAARAEGDVLAGLST